MKISEIKPVGNFQSVLELADMKITEIVKNCDEKKQYSSALAEFIKMICGTLAIIDVLEEGIKLNDVWNKDEAMIDLLFTHLLIIRANDCAHKYLNGITPAPMSGQLNDTIRIKPDVYGSIHIEE